MGIGRDTDAAIAALGAQLIAFAAARRVVEGLRRLRQAALIVAAVVNHGGGALGVVRENNPPHENPSAALHPITVLGGRDRLRPARRVVSRPSPALDAHSRYPSRC